MILYSSLTNVITKKQSNNNNDNNKNNNTCLNNWKYSIKYDNIKNFIGLHANDFVFITDKRNYQKTK